MHMGPYISSTEHDWRIISTEEGKKHMIEAHVFTFRNLLETWKW